MKNLVVIVLIVFGVAALWMISERINVLPYQDYVEYWASGRLNLNGGNPYDANQMLKMEQSAGWDRNDTIMMWNPPWTLGFAMLAGIIPYHISRFLWFLVQTSIVLFCAVTLWKIYGGKKRYEWLAIIIFFSFGPMLHTLKSGQSTILVLLGSVGFIYFMRRGSDFWAGVLAGMVLIKPHLLYLFILAIVIWSISNHRYRILVGMSTLGIVSLGVSYLINPHVISQYLYAIKAYPPDDWMTATLGGYLRILFGIDRFYLQFIPSIIGVCWLIIFWLKYHVDWDWIATLPIIILVSMATTSYGWAFDAAVCIWAVLCVAVLYNFKRWTIQSFLIITAYWVVNLMNIFLVVNQAWFFWISSFFLVWYIVSFRYLSINQKTVPQVGSLRTT